MNLKDELDTMQTKLVLGTEEIIDRKFNALRETMTQQLEQAREDAKDELKAMLGLDA